MADWPSFSDGQLATMFGQFNGTTVDNAVTGVALPVLTVANLAGLSAWTAIATTTTDSSGIYVGVPEPPNASMRVLLDIGIGPTLGTVVKIIPGIYFSFAKVDDDAGYTVYFPISIPAGTIIWARWQGSVISQFISVTVRLQASGGEAFSSRSIVTTLGADTATTQGGQPPIPLAINSVGSAQTFGVVVTPYPIEELIVAFWSRSAAFPGSPNPNIMVDIMSNQGGGGFIAIIPQLFLAGSVNMDTWPTNFLGPIPCHIPAGSLVGARMQVSSLTNIATCTPDIVVYGVS